jgi:hypothetical protein
MSGRHLGLSVAALAAMVVCGPMSSGTASARPVPAGFRAVSMSAVSTRDRWLSGTIPCRFRHRCLGLVRTLDGGRDFSRVPLPTLVDVDANQFANARFANTQDGFLVVKRFWVTHDGGHHWRVIGLGGDVQSIATGGGFVYAIVDMRLSRALLMRSPVSHDAWAVLAAAPDGFEGVTVVHDAVLLDKSVTLGGEQEFLISHDQGAGFTASRPLAETSCGALEPTPGVVWALCRGGMMDGLYRSTDGGLTFAPPIGPTVGSQNSSGVWPGGASLGAATANTAVIGFQQLFRTTDGGAIFKRVALPLAGGGWQLVFLNSRDGLALGRFGESSDPPARLYYTADDGAGYHLVRVA